MDKAYDYGARKTVIVLASDLPAGTALNVTSHLSIAEGAYADSSLMGRPVLLDGDGQSHVGISKYPVIITKVRRSKLVRVIEEARTLQQLFVVDYPRSMLTTSHDDALRDTLLKQARDEIEYLGVLVYGPSSDVDQLTRRFTLWS